MKNELKDEIKALLDETKELIEDDCVVVARDNLVQLVDLLSD